MRPASISFLIVPSLRTMPGAQFANQSSGDPVY
jgi:hypothetical protein